MAEQRSQTVMVTGAAGQWGSRVAQSLLKQSGLRVLGIDRRAPDIPDERLDFIKADVRNPLLADLLRAEQVDTVVHLAWRERQWYQEEDFDSNVLGTMLLLGACIDAGVSQVVLQSTMAVYGAQAENPMYVDEERPLNATSRFAWVREALEVEHFVQELKPDYPELRIAILRFANVIGADVDTPFTQLLRLPVLPHLLGFDPLLQVIDARDVVQAHTLAVLSQVDGPINVAGEGIVTFWQLAGMLGRAVLPVFHPVVYKSWRMFAGTRPGRRLLAWWPLEPDYLRYPWTGDLNRMRSDLRFQPRLDAVAAVKRYVEAQRVARYQAPVEEPCWDADRLSDEMRERERQRKQA